MFPTSLPLSLSLKAKDKLKQIIQLHEGKKIYQILKSNK